MTFALSVILQLKLLFYESSPELNQVLTEKQISDMSKLEVFADGNTKMVLIFL